MPVRAPLRGGSKAAGPRSQVFLERLQVSAAHTLNQGFSQQTLEDCAGWGTHLCHLSVVKMSHLCSCWPPREDRSDGKAVHCGSASPLTSWGVGVRKGSRCGGNTLCLL